MLVRSFLLFIFLLQVGVSPLYSYDFKSFKSQYAKESGKKIPKQLDILEESDDDLTDEFLWDGQINSSEYCILSEYNFSQVYFISKLFDYLNYPLSIISIIVWIQNFRI